MLCWSRLDRFASALVVISVGVLVSGTKACQEDYQFAAQSTVTPTTTLTPEGTSTGSPTAATTGTVTAAATATGTITATPIEDDDEDSELAVGDDGLFEQLSALGAKGGGGAAAAAGVVAGAKVGNWLGEAFTKDDGTWQDSDADGFSDVLEKENGTDPQSAGSSPQEFGSTRLEARISTNEVEVQVQQLAEESRENGGAGAVDTDLDGIPDEVEKQRGMNSAAADSDGDGLRDDRELVLQTNPLRADSDGDGVSDNREYLNGLDPTLPESKGGES